MTENQNTQNSRGVGTTRAAIPDDVVAWVERAKKTPLLTADEEKELGRRIAQSDEEAFQKMVEANLRLVITMALKRLHKGHNCPLTLADLIRAGHIAVMRAARKFDPERGWRFGMFASFWIRNGMSRAIADHEQNQSKAVPPN